MYILLIIKYNTIIPDGNKYSQMCSTHRKLGFELFILYNLNIEKTPNGVIFINN